MLKKYISDKYISKKDKISAREMVRELRHEPCFMDVKMGLEKRADEILMDVNLSNRKKDELLQDILGAIRDAERYIAEWH